LQGAGGIGGLLCVTESDGDVYFPAMDANGNITDYVNDSGNTVASYTFDTFGRLTSCRGDKTMDFNILFSGKYLDHETGFYCYGYRYYMLNVGRWLNRDPLREHSSVNLYGFIGNNGICNIDYLGLDEVIFIDDDGANGAGHTAKAVGDDENGWTFYSYGPGDDVSAWDMLTGADVDSELDKKEFDTLEDLEKSGEVGDYDQYQYREQSDQEDEKEKTETETEGEKDYNLYNHNCDDVAACGSSSYDSDKIRPDSSFDENSGTADSNGDMDDFKKEAKQDEQTGPCK